ncbi:MAG: archease [Candidatus Ranarchaeia archaeon]
MKKSGFRFIDHTADIIIESWGTTIEEAFSEAGKSFFTLTLDIDKVEPLEKKIILVAGFDLENLLYRWIEELLFLFEAEEMAYSKFNVLSIKEENKKFKLKAEVFGEKFNYKKHNPETEVKAMTYANINIEVKPTRTEITFTLDL